MYKKLLYLIKKIILSLKLKDFYGSKDKKTKVVDFLNIIGSYEITDIHKSTTIIKKEEKMIITKEQFSKLFKSADRQFVTTLNKLLPANKIDTLNRVSHFLSQCGHESANFRVFVENLNYSEEGLLKIFSKYFNSETAKFYARQPEKIANKVYSNRMGNGNEESGDGWKFRGRGLIQLTGKSNYISFSQQLNKTLDETVIYCESFDGIVESAIFYWNKNKCNSFADENDIIGLTKRINNGINGLSHRKELYDIIVSTIKDNFKDKV